MLRGKEAFGGTGDFARASIAGVPSLWPGSGCGCQRVDEIKMGPTCVTRIRASGHQDLPPIETWWCCKC